MVSQGTFDILVSTELECEPSTSFDIFVDELSIGLSRFGMKFDPIPDGSVSNSGGSRIGSVKSLIRPESISLEWKSSDWKETELTRLEFRFEKIENTRTRIKMIHHNFGRPIGGESSELVGWFTSELVSPLLAAMSPGPLGDWITDRRARSPSGSLARSTFRNPIYHRPNFKAILNVLDLKPQDYLLEVGCGGGAFLEDALKTGCKAKAIDHSPIW